MGIYISQKEHIYNGAEVSMSPVNHSNHVMQVAFVGRFLLKEEISKRENRFTLNNSMYCEFLYQHYASNKIYG
ncbi:hypothetical protein SAMN05216323_11003 [Williamwhitmania taraxaci]|uniref:Uncharacterized protein n=1 Tax=Williamwhitmania taraxaci TaxID=1640674 RepID=A0A1G6ST61_9BACT|nr:hypothetical protein SAMN05216323_11003 [Williamwhitmania taraxaci]